RPAGAARRARMGLRHRRRAAGERLRRLRLESMAALLGSRCDADVQVLAGLSVPAVPADGDRSRAGWRMVVVTFESGPERARRLRVKNVALALALLALVVLFFIISLVRMGGG